MGLTSKFAVGGTVRRLDVLFPLNFQRAARINQIVASDFIQKELLKHSTP